MKSQYPLAHLIAKPMRSYVPSWQQDAESLRETFKRVRRSVGKQTRVKVATLTVPEVKKVKIFQKDLAKVVDTASA